MGFLASRMEQVYYFPGSVRGMRKSGMDDLGVLIFGLISYLLYRTYLVHLSIVLSIFLPMVFVTDSHRVTGLGGDGGEATAWR